MQFSPEIIFKLLIGIIIFNFIKDFFLDYLNSKNFNNKIPEVISDVYDSEKYFKSQEYKKTQYRFSKYSKIFSLIIILSFFYFNGFIIVDSFSRNLFKSEILISLTFFGTIFFGNELLSLPFSVFFKFLIEEKFGFNKTSIKTYISDKLKSWILTILFGGGILGFIIFQEQLVGENFWIVAWIYIAFSHNKKTQCTICGHDKKFIDDYLSESKNSEDGSSGIMVIFVFVFMAIVAFILYLMD